MFIREVNEAEVPVNNLDESEDFYCRVLGLESVARNELDRSLQLKARHGSNTLILKEWDKEWPIRTIGLVFTVREAEIDQAVTAIRAKDVRVTGPKIQNWRIPPVKAASLLDPNRHAIELLAPPTA